MTTAHQKKQIFAAGYAAAVATLARDHGEDVLAFYLFRDAGMSLEFYERARIDKYDLDVLRRLDQPETDAASLRKVMAARSA